MTAAIVPAAPQSCAPIDACRSVMDRCREGVAGYLGISLDTVDRMRLSPTDSRWSDARVQAVKRFEEATLGTDTVRAALIARELRPSPAHIPDAVAGVSRDIGENATLISHENAYLAHGASDPREALALADEIEHHALHEIEEAAALRARAEVRA